MKQQPKVINVPKRKKPLATPSYIIRICLIICFVLCILLLSSPFFSARLYIRENLEVTPSITDAYTKLASQEEIDSAEQQLRHALDSLEKKKTHEESQSSETESKNGLQYTPVASANFEWSYTLQQGIDGKALAESVEEAKNIDRSLYTAESLDTLNTAVLNAQKYLCASVVVTQSVLQMAMGGSIGESLDSSLGGTISNSLFAMLLAAAPVVCFLTLCFDRKRHIKHVTCMVGAIVCVADIFLLLYPYVGSGAIWSIILYILICLFNIAGIYAKQQEDYIIAHPEKEAEFTEKHPQFVKALINYKSFSRKENKKNGSH